MARSLHMLQAAAATRTRAQTPESKTFQRDIKLKDQHVAGAQKAFKDLWKGLKPQAEAANETFPDRDEVSLQRRPREFVKLVKDLPSVTAYLNTWIGDSRDDPRATSWRSAILYQLRNVYFDPKVGLEDALKEVAKKATMGFYALAMSESQTPLRKEIPESLRKFLPQKIVVNIDEDGAIKGVTDRFTNEFDTLATKIKRQKTLIQRYNAIAMKVKKDLKSPDELVRLSAVLTAIIMETGIRPGRIGATMTKGGQEIETFGAITLGPRHVRFMREHFAQLEFVGKKGGINIAAVSDKEIVQALEDYVARAQKAGTTSIFVTKKGEAFTYSNLQSYFNNTLLKVFKPTDFRKLKATEKVLNGLRDRQEALYEQIQGFVKDQAQDAKEKVSEAVLEVVEQAYEDARAALSHDSVQVTISAYINPTVLLRFLSQGSIENSLQDAIVNNKTMLRFDPTVFIEKATGKKIAGRLLDDHRHLKQGGGRTLKQLLESLENPDDPAFKTGSEVGDLSAPTLPWHGLDDGYPARLPLWSLGDARNVNNLLSQGMTPDQIMGAPEWRKFEFTINDINDMQIMSERGMLARMRLAMMKPLQKPLTPTALAKASYIDIGDMRAPVRKRPCPFDDVRTVQKQLWLAEDGRSFGTDFVEGDTPVWGCTNCGHLYPRGTRISPKRKRLQETLDKLMKASSTRPLTSPLFNFREACKEMTLLEDHLLHPPKECPDCIRKHFLKIEGLLEESISLGMSEEMGGWITNLIEIWVGLQAQWIDNADSSADIAQEIRQLRKALTPMCFDLRERMARRIARQHLATTRGFLKFEDEQKVGQFRYKFMGNQEEGYIYIQIKRAPGWKRVGRLYQDDKGWSYKFRGYTHGHWAKWWEAASKMHKAQHFALSRTPTPPGYKTRVNKPDEIGDPDELDFAMFANSQTDLELTDTSLEQIQQYQDAWP